MTTKQLLSNTLAIHNSQSGIPRKKRHARIENQTTDGQKTVQDEATTHSATETRDTSGKWRSMSQVASLSILGNYTLVLFQLSTHYI